jgi:hypothetical protein
MKKSFRENAPANQQVTEQASRNVEAFVRYLFE